MTALRPDLFSRLYLRTKLALVMTVILAVISAAVFVYFPSALRRQALDGVAQKASVVADVTALSLSSGMRSHDRVAVAEGLASLRRNPDLVYYELRDASGQTFASFNDLVAASAGPFPSAPPETPAEPALGVSSPGTRGETVGAFDRQVRYYQTTTPIRFRGRRVGTMVIGFSLERVRQEISRSRAAIALVTLIVFAVMVLAVFALSALITGPLERIAETSKLIADGALTHRAEVDSDDEVGQLARSFNRMLDRLDAARGELESLNRSLEDRVEQRARDLMQEITARRRAQDALRSSEERYRLLFDRNLAGVYIASIDGKIISCNDACARIFRYETRDEFLADRGAIAYMNPRDRDSIMRRLRSDGAVVNEEVELRDRHDAAVWALENVRLIPAREGSEPTLEGILLDITDRKRAEEEISYKAFHDSLTDLPNRALLLDRLVIALAQAARHNQKLAVMFLDLDDLKEVNDTFGHAIGDAVLKTVGHRLKENLRESDTVARVSGDEFLILLTDIEDESGVEAVAATLLGAVAGPLMVEDDELHITTSIGVAIYPTNGTTPEELIRNADGAMYRVKRSGGNAVEFCDRSGPTVGRMTIEEELRRAIEREEFVLWYQPQVSIKDRHLVGVEALVRWNHPERGLIPPDGFISAAEHTGVITALGALVLRKACEQGKSWQRQGYQSPRIAVNLSPRQLYQHDFVGMYQRVLESTGFDPHLLEFEMTESIAVQRSDRSLQILRRLREIGSSIAVDDFGTGQSSLSYLKQFPVDVVKVDRSFVTEVLTRVRDQSIVGAVLQVANQLGLRTIAEGVETEEQCEFLRRLGCHEIQGYLVSVPLAPEQLEAKFLMRAIAVLPSPRNADLKIVR